MARRRGNSVVETIERIEQDPTHHLVGPFVPSSSSSPEPTKAIGTNGVNGTNGHAKTVRWEKTPPSHQRPPRKQPDDIWASRGLWGDITSLNWAKVPSSALFLASIPAALYFLCQALAPNAFNPFAYMLFIQHRIEGAVDERGQALYQKGYGDLAFLAYYIIIFSFVRQTVTLHIFHPLGKLCGVSKVKMDRFAEQGYALVYFSTSGFLGLRAMYSMDTWYFEGRHFFQDYPYWKMTEFMKSYYLLQFSYWLQQFLILVLGLEKPRKDFTELCIHHVVTLWLIGWSYLVNLTPIGNAVFITMDTSDVFIAISKGLNYMKLEKTSAVACLVLICVWTYGRHYLNLYILWAVYEYFDIMPETSKQWVPSEGVWMVWWMKWQIFAPLFLLQIVNGVWWLLLLRVMVRAAIGTEYRDERSDDEEEEGDKAGAETYVTEKED